MKDPRHEKLARLLTGHSLHLEPGERCLIQTTDVPDEMVESLVEAVYDAGAFPVVNHLSQRVQRSLLAGASDESIDFLAETERARMKEVDAYLGMTGIVNPLEFGDLSYVQRARYRSQYLDPVHFQERVPNTRWVVLRYPTPTMAYQAGMSTTAFEEYFYRVSVEVDYDRMRQAMERAAIHLETVDRVEIFAPGTELSFSIRDIPVVSCYGENNIPDGEIFTAPVKESVEGTLAYNVLSTYDGFTFRDVRLSFREGRIVEASANNTSRINAILDTDQGARFVGEFALGCNPAILNPMDNALFDEKIAGSIHFTPGNAYDEADNGNRSAVHWDMVLIQRPEWGGGEIRFDGEVVRKDGVFIHPAWEGLNPERLG